VQPDHDVGVIMITVFVKRIQVIEVVVSLSYLIIGYTSAKKSNSYPSGVSINLESGNRSSEKWKREAVVMANEWLTIMNGGSPPNMKALQS